MYVLDGASRCYREPAIFITFTRDYSATRKKKGTSVKGDVQDGHTLEVQHQVSSVSVVASERHFSHANVTEPLGECKAGVCKLLRASTTFTTHVSPR